MSAPMPNGNGAILLDGARYESATAWLYQCFPSHQPRPLLLGTAYEPIADAGPILLDAPVGSMAYDAWRHGTEIKDGLWLESDASMDDLQHILQRRLRIFTPEHRELWLRLVTPGLCIRHGSAKGNGRWDSGTVSHASGFITKAQSSVPGRTNSPRKTARQLN